MAFNADKGRCKLLSEMKNTDNTMADRAAAYLDVATAALDEIERLRASRSQELADAVDGERDRWLHDYSTQADRILVQAKRITEREAALITERAKSKTGHAFWSQTPLEIRKMFLKKAEEELHAEGLL
jgi:hypothetical protein